MKWWTEEKKTPAIWLIWTKFPEEFHDRRFLRRFFFLLPLLRLFWIDHRHLCPVNQPPPPPPRTLFRPQHPNVPLLPSKLFNNSATSKPSTTSGVDWRPTFQQHKQHSCGKALRPKKRSNQSTKESLLPTQFQQKAFNESNHSTMNHQSAAAD